MMWPSRVLLSAFVLVVCCCPLCFQGDVVGTWWAVAVVVRFINKGKGENM